MPIITPTAPSDRLHVQPDSPVNSESSLNGVSIEQLKAAVAEGDADVEAGRVEDADVVFSRLRAEFGYWRAARVVVTARAASEITAIGLSIRQANPRAAAELLRRIDRAIQVDIANTPEIGAPRDEVSAGLRIYVVGNYLVCDRIADDIIRVLRVFHGKRDVTRQF